MKSFEEDTSLMIKNYQVSLSTAISEKGTLE